MARGDCHPQDSDPSVDEVGLTCAQRKGVKHRKRGIEEWLCDRMIRFREGLMEAVRGT